MTIAGIERDLKRVIKGVDTRYTTRPPTGWGSSTGRR
jgi:hypothetical protein